MAQFFTNFSGYPSGQQPSDWTKEWNADQDNWLVEHPLGENKLLRQTVGDGPNAAGESLIRRNDVPLVADVEIVTKLRTSDDTDYQNQLYARATGEFTTENGYIAALYNSGTNKYATLDKWVWNESLQVEEWFSITNLEFNWKVSTWYWMRFRVNGTSLKLKVWGENDPEPVAWDLEATDSDVTVAGMTGVGRYVRNSIKDYEIVGIGTNGDTAPTEPTMPTANLATTVMYGGWGGGYAGQVYGGETPHLSSVSTNISSQIDLLLKSRVQLTHSVDIGITRRQTISSSVDILIKSRNEVSSTLDLLLFSRKSLSHSTDLFLKSRENLTHQVDIYTWADITKTVNTSVDLLLREQTRVSHSVDVLVGARRARSHNIDLFLKSRYTLDTTVDLLLRERRTISNTVDLFLRGVEVKTHQVDMLLQAGGRLEHQLDLVLKSRTTLGHQLDLISFSRPYRTYSVDMLLRVADYATVPEVFIETDSVSVQAEVETTHVDTEPIMLAPETEGDQVVASTEVTTPRNTVEKETPHVESSSAKAKIETGLDAPKVFTGPGVVGEIAYSGETALMDDPVYLMDDSQVLMGSSQDPTVKPTTGVASDEPKIR